MVQHPQLQWYRRLALHNLGGHLLNPATTFYPADFQGFLAIPDPGVGSNSKRAVDMDGYNHALGVAKRAVGSVQRPAQLRLHLRGEPGLVGQQQPGAQTLQRTSTTPARTGENLGRTELRATKKPTAARSSKHELIQKDWTAPIANEIVFNQDAIYLPMNQQDAETLV